MSEVRNCYEGKLSFRNFPTRFKFALIPAVVFLSWLTISFAFLPFMLMPSPVLTTEPELLFPKFCPVLFPAQPT